MGSTIEVTVNVDGYNVVENHFRHLIKVLDLDIDPAVADYVDEEVARLSSKPYPPTTGGRYIRTGRFGGAWASEGGLRKGSRVIVNNATDERGRLYPDYVVGDQALVHVGRWWTIKDERDDIRRGLRDQIEEIIGRAMQGGVGV